MKYTDFYKDILTEDEQHAIPENSIEYIQTGLNDGIRVGFVKKGDSGDKIRASNMRAAYKNKIHKCLVDMDKYLFHKLKFSPIPVDIIFSVVKSDDSGETFGYVRLGDNKIFARSDFLSGSHPEKDIVETFVHEWTHIWHYDKFVDVDDIIESKYESVKKEKVKRISPYGLTNHFEFWTYLVENYDRLDADLKEFVESTIQSSK